MIVTEENARLRTGSPHRSWELRINGPTEKAYSALVELAIGVKCE